jgi:hypothetical protein
MAERWAAAPTPFALDQGKRPDQRQADTASSDLAQALRLMQSGGNTMAEEKRVTETETKTKNDSFGDPKETKTTSKETKSDSSGNKQETNTEYKEKR